MNIKLTAPLLALPLFLLAQQRDNSIGGAIQAERERQFNYSLPKKTRTEGNTLVIDPAAAEEYKQTLADVERLHTLTEELRAGLTSKDANVLSLSELKRTDEIEKLAKKIRARMHRW
jgi:phosphoenolpyruvate synthase/pyruvate phosphate dikinase